MTPIVRPDRTARDGVWTASQEGCAPAAITHRARMSSVFIGSRESTGNTLHSPPHPWRRPACSQSGRLAELARHSIPIHIRFARHAFRSEPHKIATLGDREVWLPDLEDTKGNMLALMSEPRPRQ